MLKPKEMIRERATGGVPIRDLGDYLLDAVHVRAHPGEVALFIGELVEDQLEVALEKKQDVKLSFSGRTNTFSDLKNYILLIFAFYSISFDLTIMYIANVTDTTYPKPHQIKHLRTKMIPARFSDGRGIV